MSSPAPPANPQACHSAHPVAVAFPVPARNVAAPLPIQSARLSREVLQAMLLEVIPRFSAYRKSATMQRGRPLALMRVPSLPPPFTDSVDALGPEWSLRLQASSYARPSSRPVFLRANCHQPSKNRLRCATTASNSSHCQPWERRVGAGAMRL
jgi:hypothetical protein